MKQIIQIDLDSDTYKAQRIAINSEYKLLGIQASSYNNPILWALVDTDQPQVSILIECCYTNESITDSNNLQYLGTLPTRVVDTLTLDTHFFLVIDENKL